MGQEHAGDVGEGDLQLVQPLHGAAPGIDDEFLIAGLDQGARPHSVEHRRRRPGAEKCHPKRPVR